MRTVLIRINGAKRPIHKLQLEPGTKVSDVLQALNVQGYVLARSSEPTTPFPSEAEVHSLVSDSDHLIARSSSAAVEDAAPFTLSLTNEES
jgi:hypothetical protein